MRRRPCPWSGDDAGRAVGARQDHSSDVPRLMRSLDRACECKAAVRPCVKRVGIGMNLSGTENVGISEDESILNKEKNRDGAAQCIWDL